MKHAFSASMLAVACLFSAHVSAAPLEIAGSTSVQKTIVDPTSAKVRDVTGLELKMLAVGTGKGLRMLTEGKVSVAAVSDDLADAVELAKTAGATSIPPNLKMVTIMTDRIIAISHPDNKVPALTKDQLASIFTGKITNWKEVGGSDAKIDVVVPAQGAGTRAVFEKKMLGGGAFAATAKEMRTDPAVVLEVGRDADAIGLMPLGMLEGAKGKIREIKGPEVSRPLGFVTVGEATPDVKKLLDFLSSEDAKKLYAQ